MRLFDCTKTTPLWMPSDGGVYLQPGITLRQEYMAQGVVVQPE
ncbi:hypothetical protein NIES3974_03960 [Calothrix sp. NIES-3974]|nr:hypothetical protein NIES3974_03960 [Calothrix sp. NIES-3974]